MNHGITKTIALIDMCSSTRASFGRKLGEDAEIKNLSYEKILEIVQGKQGDINDEAGDAWVCLFNGATVACQSAKRVSETLSDYIFEHKNERVLFSIGIHTSDVEFNSRGSLCGDGVNFAAVIEGFAPPGQAYLSRSTYDCLNKNDVEVEFVRKRYSEKLERKISLYRLVLDKVQETPEDVKKGTGTSDANSVVVEVEGKTVSATSSNGNLVVRVEKTNVNRLKEIFDFFLKWILRVLSLNG